MGMKTLMNHSQDGGLLKMISRDPVIFKKVLCFFFCLFTDIYVIAGNLAEITTARVGAAVTHPWAAGARNAEIDVSQWDSFVSGNYQNLKWDYPNH